MLGGFSIDIIIQNFHFIETVFRKEIKAPRALTSLISTIQKKSLNKPLCCINFPLNSNFCSLMVATIVVVVVVMVVVVMVVVEAMVVIW